MTNDVGRIEQPALKSPSKVPLEYTPGNDHTGPGQDKQELALMFRTFVIIVDAYSKWINTHIMNSSLSEATLYTKACGHLCHSLNLQTDFIKQWHWLYKLTNHGA